MKHKTLLIAAGGTGGHVFPAQALADQAISEGWDVHFICDTRGTTWSGFNNTLHLKQIYTGNFGRGNILKKIFNLIPLCFGILQSVFYIRKIKPNAVIGFGGYPSFPVIIASLFFKTTRIVHEQNAVLGRVNKWVSLFITAIATSFPLTKFQKKAVRTGIPIRSDLKDLAKTLNINSSSTQLRKKIKDFRITILGGSQGAKIFSDIVPKALDRVHQKSNINLHIIHQVRPEYLNETTKFYTQSNINARVETFLSDMGDIYLNSDLVISRAGASSIAEICCFGLPSILVPYLHAMDNHQFENAKDLAHHNACILIPQVEFTTEKLENKILELINSPQHLEQLSKNARNKAVIDADEKILKLIDEYTNN